MVGVELNLSLESRHMLTVDLESHSPEVSFPNKSTLCVLESQVVLIVYTLGIDEEIEIGNVEPESHD